MIQMLIRITIKFIIRKIVFVKIKQLSICVPTVFEFSLN